MLSEKHFEDSELELQVWEDKELLFMKFELWPDTQLLNSKFFFCKSSSVTASLPGI